METKKVTIELPKDFYDWLRNQAYFDEVNCESSEYMTDHGYKELSISRYIAQRLFKCCQEEDHHNSPVYKKPVMMKFGCICERCIQWEKY